MLHLASSAPHAVPSARVARVPRAARAVIALAALGLALLLAAGCERSPAPEVSLAERRAQQAPYQQRHAATSAAASDSQQTAMTPLDTLFVGYDAATLRALRPDTTGAAAWVDSMLAALSLEEKIGQLIIVQLPPTGGLRARIGGAARALVDRGVGGFLIPRTLGPREVHHRVRRVQRRAEVPLFIAADYERGAGRFSNAFTELPSSMALGATRDSALAAAAGRLTAIESRAAGVNLLFAPVVDVNNNPANPIINIRSYGARPALVGRMATAFVRAAQAQGLLTTLKHFPGHGNTSTDSHAQMGAVTSTPEELRRIELAPYRVVLEATDPAAVMTAHLWIEALDAEPLPATFSRNALTGVLRERLGFDGLIVTDDVKMGALQNDFSLAERVLRPLEAGADVVLTPEDVEAGVDAVKGAVDEGRLSEARLDRSVRRVLRAKARAGLHRRRLVEEHVLEELLERPRGEVIAQAIADRAVTLLKNGSAADSAAVLPLREGEEIALVQLSNYRDSESIDAAMDDFAAVLEERNPVTAFRFEDEVSEEARAEVLRAAAEADVVVLALYLRLTSGRGEAGLFDAQKPLARALMERQSAPEASAGGTPVALVTLGNPYAPAAFPDAAALITVYDQTLASAFAAARVLRGRQPPRGELPVTVGPYAYGHGLDHVGEGAQEGTGTAARRR